MSEKLPNDRFDDLFQSGWFGLVDALAGYEPRKGACFITYAVTRIRGEMADLLRHDDHMNHTDRTAWRKLDNAYWALANSLGREPKASELAASAGTPLSMVYELQELNDYRRHILYADLDTDDTEWLESVSADYKNDPFNLVAEKELEELIPLLLKKLRKRWRIALDMHYQQGKTMSEIAVVLGVTESRICQICRAAVDELRNRLKGFLPVEKQKDLEHQRRLNLALEREWYVANAEKLRERRIVRYQAKKAAARRVLQVVVSL